MIKIKRVYQKYDVTDGTRILVDRLWPRGVRHSTANIDKWFKDVAPSTELRKWFAHDVSKWKDFKKRYIQELQHNKAFEKLLKLAESNSILTLIYASSDNEHNNAVVLKELLEKSLHSKGKNEA